MSKKTVTLILIFAIFFSVIAMAVWGKVPEVSGDIYVSEIIFFDADGHQVAETNDGDLQEKKIVLERDSENTVTYTFQVMLLPADATDVSIEWKLEMGEATLDKIDYIDNIVFETSGDNTSSNEEEVKDEHRNVHSYRITFTDQNVTSLSFTSNLSGTRVVKDYLMFVFEGSSHEGHIDL